MIKELDKGTFRSISKGVIEIDLNVFADRLALVLFVIF